MKYASLLIVMNFTRQAGQAQIDADYEKEEKSVDQYHRTPARLNSLRGRELYYTYVLQSGNDGNFYVGFTKDLKLRFEKHSKGQVESTRDRRPLNLVYYEACLSQDDATRREKYLKTYYGRMFLRRRLKSYLTG